MGCTVITGKKDGITAKQEMLVPVGDRCLIQRVTLCNETDLPRLSGAHQRDSQDRTLCVQPDGGRQGCPPPMAKQKTVGSPVPPPGLSATSASISWVSSPPWTDCESTHACPVLWADSMQNAGIGVQSIRSPSGSLPVWSTESPTSPVTVFLCPARCFPLPNPAGPTK